VDGGDLSGSVNVAGMSISGAQMYQIAEHIGSVFQNPKSQFFNLDSNDEIVFGLENAGIPPVKIKERLAATISALQIGHLLDRDIFSMSAGEKQSLAFASVYAINPDVFVLDEPTANLDAEAIEILRKNILQAKKEGRTVIIAEHRLYFLMDLIDKAIFIQRGKIVRTFTGDEFKQLPEQERIAMGLRALLSTSLHLEPAELPQSKIGLSVENLSCNFEKQNVFREVGFSVTPGTVLAIVGRNGIGKTTLIRCLCGLLKETEGNIKLDGTVLKPRQRQKLFFCVMQDVNHQLFSDSVWNECELSSPDCTAAQIEEVLGAFDLMDFKDRHPMALSGGQKQRLAIATAVLSDKRVLVFDEPTSGLDYRRMLEVDKVIRQLSGKGKIIIIVSHDYEFLERTCDKILYMGK
jgi:energy-coupling factor transport system ATP-binding protein